MAHVIKDSMNHYAIEIKRGPKHVQCVVRLDGQVELKQFPHTKLIVDHEYNAHDGTYLFDQRWEICQTEQDAHCHLDTVVTAFLDGMLPITDTARGMLEALRINPGAVAPLRNEVQTTNEDSDMATKKVKKTAVKKTAVKKTAVKKTAVKKTAVKKTAVKKTAVKKTAGEKNQRYLPEMKIKVLVDNPKRDGTQAHKMFSLYEKCATVADFIKKGGSRADLSWDSKHGFIKIS